MIKSLPAMLFLGLCPFLSGPPAAATAAEEAASGTGVYSFFTSQQIQGDPLFFVHEEGRPAAEAVLLQVPEVCPVIRSATQETTFEQGKDFLWQAGSRTITLTPGSRIPFFSAAALQPVPGSPQSYNGSRNGTSWMLFGEGRFFHDRQAVASYPTNGSWQGVLPAKAPDSHLANLRKGLRASRPLRMVTLGDSISTGANASGAASAPPFQPGYPDLVASGLQNRFGPAVHHRNLSVGGMDSVWGLRQVPAVLAETPDLVLLAFGMNDASAGRSTEDFAANMQEMAGRIQTARPGCEVILVAPMTANPQWNRSAPALYPAYAAALGKLAGPGRAFADVTTLWTQVLERKSYLSLSGNGLNHPNDFGHRLYAAVILAAIGN